MTLPQTFTDALPAMTAAAAASGSDYKALVCVFLAGGNDSHSTVIPTGAAYTAYAAARGSISISPVPTALTGQACGLHPNLSGVATLFNAGRVSILANVGMLAYPLTKAEYGSAYVPGVNPDRRPIQLFSHSDQQLQWHTLLPEDQSPLTGWGGRLTDLIKPAFNGSSIVPCSISTAGQTRFLSGYEEKQYKIGINVPTPIGNTTQYSGLRSGFTAFMTSTAQANVHEAEINRIIARGSANANAMATSLNTYDPSGAEALPSTFLGNQLRMVARIIAQRVAFGHRRDTFFVQVGSFDSHDSAVQGTWPGLLTQLNDALVAFDACLGNLNGVNVRNNVTTFTASDFGRTLVGNASGGTDHGWGGHHFIMGGTQLVGSKVFYKANVNDTTVLQNGTFPDMTLNGPNDAGEGRLLPTTSAQEYAATFAKWLGVPNAVSNGVNPMALVIPNLSRFTKPDLGFLV